MKHLQTLTCLSPGLRLFPSLRPGRLKALFKNFRDCRSGASLVEYGILAAILGVGLVVSFVLMSNNVNAPIDTVNEEIVEQLDTIDDR